MKKKMTVILALVMALLFAVQTPLGVLADAQPDFISDMIMLTVTDGKKETAQAKLTGDYADYILLDDPIYKGDNCSTFIAYKLTKDPDQAIVDVQAMHMTGGYSYEEYAEYLNGIQKLTASLVDSLKPTVNEARTNYEAGKAGAKYAYKVLSTIYDDNTQQTVADFLFKGEKFNMASQASRDKDAQFVTIIMQGNIQLVEAIEKALVVACADGQKYNFLEVLNEMSPDTDMPRAYTSEAGDLIATLESVQVPVTFYDKFNRERRYDPTSQKLQDEIEEQAELIKAYANENPQATVAEAREAIRLKRMNEKGGIATNLYKFERDYENLSLEQKELYQLGQMLSEAMMNCNYPLPEYEKLYDLIMKSGCEVRMVNTQGENGVAQTVTGVENFNPEDFIPLMMSLTPGQRGLCKIGFAELLLSTQIPAESYVSCYNVMETVLKPQGTVTGQGDAQVSETPEGTISVYAGVDRTLFDPDGIAMTSAAINRKNGGDDSFAKVNMTTQQREMLHFIGMAAGGTAAVITTTILVGAAISQAVTRSQLVADKALYESIAKSARASVLDSTSMGQTELFESNVKVAMQSVKNAERGLEANTFRASLTRVLSSVFTKIMAVLDIIAIIVLVVDIVMLLISIITEDKTDAPYVEIPRVLCSVQNIYNGRLDETGERIIEPGYVYYYGVKNPGIDRGDVNDKSNPYRFGIGDIYNWTLKGPYREWIALYMTKDQRVGNPIKASSLKVSATPTVQGSRALEYFHSAATKACDFMFYYRQTKDNQSLGSSYLLYQKATDEEMQSFTASTAGSVFASGASWAFASAGLVMGAAGGIGVKTVADRKKKKAEGTV